MRIREKNSDPGSGINIPDPPQHCFFYWHFNLYFCVFQLNRSEESNGSVVSNGSAVDMSELDGGCGATSTSPKQKKRPTIGGFWTNSKEKTSGGGGGVGSNRKSQKGLFKKRSGKEGGEGGIKAAEGDLLDNKVR
jgi:hypothetical protein